VRDSFNNFPFLVWPLVNLTIGFGRFLHRLFWSYSKMEAATFVASVTHRSPPSFYSQSATSADILRWISAAGHSLRAFFMENIWENLEHIARHASRRLPNFQPVNDYELKLGKESAMVLKKYITDSSFVLGIMIIAHDYCEGYRE